jgi:hypothetical protein
MEDIFSEWQGLTPKTIKKSSLSPFLGDDVEAFMNIGKKNDG